MILRSRRSDPWAVGPGPSPADSFWASYSDLMAGVLLVFALTTAMTMLSIGSRLVKTTEKVDRWKELVSELCSDPQLQTMEGVRVDCNTGALIIQSDRLQFAFNNTQLGEEGKALLREVVPIYLNVVRRKPELQEFVDTVEIAGHTDRKDLNQANPQISRDRAGAVLAYLLAEPALEEHWQFLKEKAVTAGYADTRFEEASPPCEQDECPAARRVEITVRLKDAEILAEFGKILEQIYKARR
ncbi:OmpA/MotB family protein [Deferrisoma sp.]